MFKLGVSSAFSASLAVSLVGSFNAESPRMPRVRKGSYERDCSNRDPTTMLTAIITIRITP